MSLLKNKLISLCLLMVGCEMGPYRLGANPFQDAGADLRVVDVGAGVADSVSVDDMAIARDLFPATGCIYGKDETCAEVSYFSQVAGACNPDGTCTCKDPFEKSPYTGRCYFEKVCSPLKQNCASGAAWKQLCYEQGPNGSWKTTSCGKSNQSYGCYSLFKNGVWDKPSCLAAGAVIDGQDCVHETDCVVGSICLKSNDGSSVCSKMCSLSGGDSVCANDEVCADVQSPYFGICRK